LAGGEAWLIFCAWRYGREDPFRLYHRLDAQYRPMWDPGLPEVRPRRPDRLRAFLYACGKAAAILDGKMESKNLPQRPPDRQPDPRRQR
jgi:hypothetical protein